MLSLDEHQALIALIKEVCWFYECTTAPNRTTIAMSDQRRDVLHAIANKLEKQPGFLHHNAVELEKPPAGK